MHDTLSDMEGRCLPRNDVEEIVVSNVLHNMSFCELAVLYMEGMTDDELVEWATNDEGNFSN